MFSYYRNTSTTSNSTPTTDAAPVDFSAELGAGKKYTIDAVATGAKHFGDVTLQPASRYTAGDSVAVKFAGGNPLNDLRPQGSFLEIRRCSPPSSSSCEAFAVVAVDGDWETSIKIHTEKRDLLLVAREWEIEWNIPATAQAGNYSIAHMATHHSALGKFTNYTGLTNVFSVWPAQQPLH